MNLLEIKKVCGGYNKKNVLHDISFNVKNNDFLGIIGPNGSGKSTLLKLLSRVLVPSQGTVLFEQKDLSKLDLKSLFKRVAFVPQDTLINFSYSVWEIVLMGRIPHLNRLQLETKKDFLIAKKALSLTDALYLKEKKIDQLSAGERQRVIIAKALAQEPSLLFLDEPTSHLDIGHQMQILKLLKKLNQQMKLTIVMVLHDLNLASEYCNRLILLNKGEIYQEGTSIEVLNVQNIETVYKTKVVVQKNPISGNPNIILTS
jgi:iron complex transport system ATP-binding protein